MLADVVAAGRLRQAGLQMTFRNPSVFLAEAAKAPGAV
jgi:hypothetical protein